MYAPTRICMHAPMHPPTHTHTHTFIAIYADVCQPFSSETRHSSQIGSDPIAIH